MTSPPTLHDLPLFPLGTVLFPGGLLPLRIFEVRYLDMIRRCQAAGTPFGVVCLTQGHEVRQAGAPQERFAEVGTLARLLEVEAPQPGLLMIRAEGLQRFRLRRSGQLKHGLWVGDAELLPDDLPVPVPDDLKDTGLALAQVLERLRAQAARAGALSPVAEPWHLEDCGWVANRWCELLPLAPALKQQLLELDTPLLRLELVGDVLSRHGQAGD
ncbi:LON peptidase substrate-binding domain-containing protein [Ramlibacter sp. MAHUQ-53]|uniref:LON peptidase substrate-binding domain-containing protein n=1 Tax=unclassified Ramlibacter TaxID=2617605 RepID=UPI00363A755F